MKERLGSMQNSMKKIIAITGGIGSGKSCTLKILSENGFNTISCDQVVSFLYKKHGVKKILKRIFPTAVSGKLLLKIDRKKISSLAFNDDALHSALTNAITPLVLKEVLKRAKTINGNVFVEVPLLFECGYQDKFDKVLIIYRDKNSRIESVKSRSNLSEQEILARMAKQFDYDNNDLTSFTLINNDQTLTELKEKVLSFANSL